MKDLYYILEQLSFLMKVGIWYENEGGIERHWGLEYQNPLEKSDALKKNLRKKASCQYEPVLYEDSFQVLWICLKIRGNCAGQTSDSYLFAGPFSMRRMEKMEWYHYCMEYQLNSKLGRYPDLFSPAEVISFVQLLANLFLGEKLNGKELLRKSEIVPDMEKNLKEEKNIFLIQRDQEERHHHTYYEEWKLLEYVRCGNVREAMKMNLLMDDRLGRLGKDELEHWRNVVVVVVTLCTRAAIEGGVNPTDAYFLSDFYIRKSAGC